MGDSLTSCYHPGSLASGVHRVSQRRDWNAVIDKLNRSQSGQIRVYMGSPGSAQVTRCRLLEQWRNLDVWTIGPTLHLRIKA